MRVPISDPKSQSARKGRLGSAGCPGAAANSSGSRPVGRLIGKRNERSPGRAGLIAPISHPRASYLRVSNYRLLTRGTLFYEASLP
jgi:hypothetical protein